MESKIVKKEYCVNLRVVAVLFDAIRSNSGDLLNDSDYVDMLNAFDEYISAKYALDDLDIVDEYEVVKCTMST